VPTNLAQLLVIDIAPVQFTNPVKNSNRQSTEFMCEFSPEFVRWLGNLVDNINENTNNIMAELASLSARITALGG
jgi:hypothetical protein